MWHDVIAYLIVALAACYVTWRWTSIEARASVISFAMISARRFGVSNVRAAKWQEFASAKSGCGSCGPCKACNTNAK